MREVAERAGEITPETIISEWGDSATSSTFASLKRAAKKDITGSMAA